MVTVKYLEFSGLLNQGVSDFVKFNNELSACKNVYEYEIGKLEKVPGYSKCNDSQVVASEDVNFLYHYYNSSSKTNYLLGASDSGTDYVIRYRTDGVWTDITNGTYTSQAGAQVDMQTFLDKVFVVGYNSSTSAFLSNATINGTTLDTADTDLTNMPQGKYIVRYRDLLYVLYAQNGTDIYPNRAYYCDEPTSGAITWTPATNFLEFGYDDGDEITGGIDAFDRLIVFKHFSMWKYDESERKKIADIGCDSFKSIIKIGGVVYWANRDGVWRWLGGQPQLISNKAKKFFDAMDKSNLERMVAVQHDFEYRVYLGDITVDGYTYVNTWFCFDTRKEKVYIRCTYDKVKSACTYVENGNKRAYFGNDNGYVMKFAIKQDNIYSDDGNEIDSFFATKNLSFGSAYVIKHTNHLTIFSKYAQNMKVSVALDNNDQYTQSLGQILQKNIEELDINSDAYRYRFKFYEKSSAKSWQFEGFVVKTDLKEIDE